MTRCLNPRTGGGHENVSTAVTCERCDFLVQGAHVGAYEVVSFIGAGTYGYVYKVREPAPLSRILALKVLRFDQFREQTKVSFFQEARRIASMQHPNILPIYNFGQIEGSGPPYFVTEYAPQTITEYFTKADHTRRQAFAEELVPFVRQTADALQYVHNAGMVHQDVKPGNLLIGRNGQVLLADFGTTFYLGMHTHASLGEATGTAGYMPPEQWQGAPRRDSDQYAFACCCYELLTGRTPFIYRRLEEMWNAHLREPASSPQQWNPRLPAEVGMVLLRALSKDYHQRYRNITAFAEAFSQAVEIAQQRYVCQLCGFQNRTGAQRCANCGTDNDQRRCVYCQAFVRFGQRCCSMCGRLALPPDAVVNSPLVGVSLRQGRYTIMRILKQSEDEPVMTSVARDANNQLVVLKRWECSDQPLTQRATDVTFYDRATKPLATIQHPLLPKVLDRFAEGRHYYLASQYIDGESLAEHLQRILRPLPEAEGLGYMYSLLNVLMELEKYQIRHYALFPEHILLERTRKRALLSGFHIPTAPGLLTPRTHGARNKTTRKLAISPYLPVQDRPYDQRTCIYALTASFHHALTNVAPPHYPTYPPMRMLNPAISTECEAVFSRALAEDPTIRYQNYAAFKRDLQKLLARP